jgi:hypothetical protein
MPAAHIPKRATQQIDVRSKQTLPPIRQIDREKEAASGEEVAAIVGHGAGV